MLLQQFLLWESRADLYYLHGCICLSRFQGVSLPCAFSSLLHPRKVINTQFFHLFSCNIGNENFLALYMLELKPEFQGWLFN